MSKSSVAHPRSASYNNTEDEVDIEEEPVDTGLIRCICNSSEDDGFTIQCERCLIWQHAYCVKISQNNIPEHYLCDQCERKYGSPGNITTTTVTWRDQLEQFSKAVENDVRSVLDKKLRQRANDFNHVTTSSSSNGFDNGSSNNNGKHHFRDIHNRIGEDDDYKPGRRPLQQNKKNPVGRPPKKPKLSKRIQVSKRSLQELELQDHSNNNSDSGGGGPPFRKRRQETSSSTSSNNGRRDFQRVDHNVIRSKHAKQVFKDARERLARLEKGKGKSVNGTTTTTQLPQPAAAPILVPTANQHIVIGDELKKASGAKASIRPLSKRWQYQSSSSSTTTTADAAGPTTQEKRQGLFADADIGRNQLVAEVNGDIVLKSEYKFDPGNDFAVLGTPCAHVFFYPTLDLCIDARYRGNDTRKIRRSCHPNAELRSIIGAPHAPDQEIRLGIFARADIKKGDEITIGWNWQRGHISWKKNLEWHDCGMTDGHQVIDVEEERSSRSALTRMLNYFADEFGDCACNDINLCFIEHLKAIHSGNDESPLTNYKSSTSSRQQGVVRSNGIPTTPLHPDDEQRNRAANKEALSPAIAQPPSSRQTAIFSSDNAIKTEYRKKPHAMEVEDNIVIDVVSTSPLVRSPMITVPAKGVSDVEEELDIDGDIDVGDETMNYVPSGSSDSRRRSSSERSLSTGSSLSSLSGSDNEARNQRSGKRARSSKKTNGEKPCKRHSIGDALKLHGDKPGKPKLPCKKAWMRNFMQQATTPTASPPTMISRDPTPDKPKDETISPAILKQEQDVPTSNKDNNDFDDNSKYNDSALQSKDQEKQPEDPSTNKEPESVPGNVSSRHKCTPPPLPPAVIDMELEEDDGELSDASSASTIPIIDRDDDRLMDPPSEEKKDEESNNPALPSDEALQQQQEKENEQSTTDKSAADEQQQGSTVHQQSEAKQEPVLPANAEDPTGKSQVSVTQEPKDEQHEGSVAAATKQQQSNEDTEVLTANDSSDEQKPTKVKLSLQEYLARRGTPNQSSVRVAGEEQKSQDCGSKAESHPWIASSSQVEVTMETRQPEAQ